MGTLGHIDREKHEADILERIVKGVRPEEVESRASSQVTDRGVRPWLGGRIVSAVHVRIVDNPPDE